MGAHETYWGSQEGGVICGRLLGLLLVMRDFVCPVTGDLIALDRDLVCAVDNADFVVNWILANGNFSFITTMWGIPPHFEGLT